MNCQEFWRTMPSGEGYPHLDECPACAARMDRLRELAGGMRALAATMANAGAPPRVEARLLTVFRSQSGELPVVRRRRWLPAMAWAAALAAVILCGVFLVRQRQPEASRSPRHQVELALNESFTDALESAAEEGFVLLPGADQLAPAGDVSVLHVELPRSAMMQVGIEVSPEQSGETVRADVMVGSDGLARAVRFEAAGSD